MLRVLFSKVVFEAINIFSDNIVVSAICRHSLRRGDAVERKIALPTRFAFQRIAEWPSAYYRKTFPQCLSSSNGIFEHTTVEKALGL